MENLSMTSDKMHEQKEELMNHLQLARNTSTNPPPYAYWQNTSMSPQQLCTTFSNQVYGRQMHVTQQQNFLSNIHREQQERSRLNIYNNNLAYSGGYNNQFGTFSNGAYSRPLTLPRQGNHLQINQIQEPPGPISNFNNKQLSEESEKVPDRAASNSFSENNSTEGIRTFIMLMERKLNSSSFKQMLTELLGPDETKHREVIENTLTQITNDPQFKIAARNNTYYDNEIMIEKVIDFVKMTLGVKNS